MNDYLKEEVKRLEEKIKKTERLLEDPQLKLLAQEEIKALKVQVKSLKNIPAQEKTKKSSNSLKKVRQGNAIIEVRAAAGGEEAKIWTSDLIEMYTRYAELENLEAIPLGSSTIKIKGKQAFPLFQFESGVHRVQRIPQTETQGRVHTSAATVAGKSALSIGGESALSEAMD